MRHSLRRHSLLWEISQLFFQIIQASFKVGQTGRRDILPTPRTTTLRLNLGLLCVATQALQLYSQLIECGINARQISVGQQSGPARTAPRAHSAAAPCRHRLVLSATLTLQGCRVSLQRLQVSITRTAYY